MGNWKLWYRYDGCFTIPAVGESEICGIEMTVVSIPAVREGGIGNYKYIIFVQGGSPTPHPFSSRPHFVFKFSHQRSTEVF